MRRARVRILALAAATVAVFVLDALTPLGIAVPILYVPILGVSARFCTWRVTWSFLAVSALLTLLGMAISPPPLSEPAPWIFAFDRVLGVLVGGIVAWLAFAAQRARAKQQEAQQTLWFTLRNSPLMVCAQDEQLRYARVFNRQLGIEPAELIGKTDIEAFGPHVGEELTELKRRAMRTGQGLHEEVRLTINGQHACYDVMVEPTPEVAGQRGITSAVLDVTHRQLADEALRRSEEQLRQFVEHVPAAVAMFDRDMRYLAHSRRWQTDLYPQESNLIGRRSYDVFPAMPARWKDTHRRASAGEVVETQQEEFIGPDSQAQVIRREVRPWYDREGRIGGILVLVEVITEQTRIERQLRASEALYRSLVESVPESVWRKDLDGRYTFANRRYLELLGRSLDQVIGCTDHDFFPAELAAKYGEDDRRVMQTGSNLETLECFRTHEGQLLEIRTVKTPVINAEGQTVGTQGIFWDTTEKRRAEEALRRSERDFRALAENLPDMIGRFDRELRHLYVNTAVEQLTDTPLPAYLGRTNTELHGSTELIRQWDEALSNVFKTGRAEALEWDFVDRLGVPRHFESRILPELAADGTVGTVLAISRDVTERVKAAEAEQAHLAELAHVSRLSTMGELVSEIAHEINQPLHAITNFAQAGITVLDQTSGDQRAQLFGWFKQICEQAHRAAEIIKHARRFTRKSPVNRTTVDLNELVRECLKLVNFDLRMHRVKLHCDLAADLPPVLADSVQIQQVLVNLLRNAVEAMADNDQDDLRLIVRTTYSEQEVRACVGDNGRGLTSESASRLFEPFYTTKPNGMGMGLAVSQSIVQAHGGRLWAQPNSDRGSCFIVALPVLSGVPNDVYCNV